MSFVTDQVRKVDNQLDRLQLSSTVSDRSSSSSPEYRASSEEAQSEELESDISAKKTAQLQSTIKSLSTASGAHSILPASRLLSLLEQIDLSQEDVSIDASQSAHTKELEWLLVSKATVQTYGLILDSFLNHTIPLNDDIWYWDEVLGSYTWSTWYMLQTSPLRLWGLGKEVQKDVTERLGSLRTRAFDHDADEEQENSQPMAVRWSQFYGLVKSSVQSHWSGSLQSKLLSPVTKCRLEARRKQRHLKKLREMSASGLGMLMDEGLSFDADDLESETSKQDRNDEWKSIVAKSVSLMLTVLDNVNKLETTVHDFEDVVFSNVENDPIGIHGEEEGSFSQPVVLADKLKQILAVHLPRHAAESKHLTRHYGRPSRIVRYWPAATLLFLSGSTLLRIFFRRKAEIIQWIRDFGTTTRDFWFNWIVDPVKKIIGTIRHDKDSDIAVISKESLKGDRESLERMVVDFVVDSPEGRKLGDAELANMRAKVKEGDLTPVLKAYEKDLRSPFMGTIRGNLIRTLLIQVQKTKVDVEVAISGIDALLKSQELVFGFVGLTPGILVLIAVGRWFSSYGGRKGKPLNQRKVRIIRTLRNIDRILTACTPSSNGMLSYKEHGLLLCEVHVLRQNGHYVFPMEIYREFLEEIDDMVDIRPGVERQLKVVERMRWAYWKWLQ